MSGELVIAREPVAALLDCGLERMLRAHYEEVAVDRDEIQLNPDWDRYMRAERDGAWLAYGVRKKGELVGYTAFFISRGWHYRDHVFAVNDVIYVEPKHRGIDGLTMVLESERVLRAMGVKKVVYHTKTEAFLGESDDSLAALERLMELEEIYGVKMPENVPVAPGTTLGDVLAAIGYRHDENHYSKLLLEAGR